MITRMISISVRFLLLGLFFSACNINSKSASKEEMISNYDSLVVALKGSNYKLILSNDERLIDKQIDWFLRINSCQWNTKEYESASKQIAQNILDISKYDVLCDSIKAGKFEIWNCNDIVAAKNIYGIFNRQGSFSCIAHKVFAYMVRFKNMLLIVSCDIPCSNKLQEFSNRLKSLH